MISWIGWTSKMIFSPPSPRTSSTSVRSVQKTSGLFDKGFAGDLKQTDFKPSADEDALLTPTIDASDDALMLGLDSGMLPYLDPLAEASLDSFVDLNNFFSSINEDKTVELMDGAADIKELISKAESDDVAVETATPTLKRKFEEVEEQVVDVVDMEEVVVVTTTPDHDYVSKRPRLSTSSVSDDGETSGAAASHVTRNPERKYRERRDKNNVASRRSREIRKQKFKDMEVEADQLVVENKKLQVKIVELEKLAKEMKATLVAKLAGK